MSAADGPRRNRTADPVMETCPLCEFSGPRVVVYRHLDRDHPDIDPADVFADPLGE